jgi:hypothetical protein
MTEFHYKNFIINFILIIAIGLNILDIKINNFKLNTQVSSDIILSLFLFSVYTSYIKVRSKFQLIGFMSIVYICLIIFINRRYSLPTTIDILLSIPFLFTVIYCLRNSPNTKFK